MPIHIASAYLSRLLALDALPVLLASFVAISVLRTWSAGVDLITVLDRATVQAEKEAEPGQKPKIRPRDLHGTVTIVVGGFTSQGLLTCAQLSSLGSQLILLTPSIGSDRIVQLVHLLRDGTSNPLIFAEECDVTNLASIEAFAAHWNLGEAAGVPAQPTTLMNAGKGNSTESAQAARPGVGPRRVDSVIFMPLDEARLGIRRHRQSTPEGLDTNFAELLGRFHLVNLLLPSLFLLPPNRDIRIISLLSPWYAAGQHVVGHGKTSITQSLQQKVSPWTLDGRQSLVWHALSRELQRRIQLLTEADQRPRTKLPGIDDEGRITGKATPTNVNLINVCAGFERGRDVLDYVWPFAGEIEPIGQGSAAHFAGEAKEGEDKEAHAEQLKSLVDPRLRQRKKGGKVASDDKVKVGFTQLQSAADRRSALSHAVNALQALLVIVLWPLAWLLCKTPRRVAESVTWAAIAPVRTDQVFDAAGMKGTAVVPAELHREGRIVRPALSESLMPGPGMQSLWKDLESSAKRALASKST